MNVDYLKIDFALVVNILKDKISDSMVSAIYQVGHSMGLRTVAEFVENMDIRDRLAEIGVDYVQGYGIKKPKPISQILNPRMKIGVTEN